MNLATIYLGGVSILIVGWLWFFVVRPIVMDIRDAIDSRRTSGSETDAIIVSRSLPRRRYQRVRKSIATSTISVNTFNGAASVMSSENAQTAQTGQTEKQTDPVSEADRWLDRVELDRTKTTLIELLVYSGWDVGQIRSVVKGDNGAIGTEIEAARKRLGMTPPTPRMLTVRDGSQERHIPYQEPMKAS